MQTAYWNLLVNEWVTEVLLLLLHAIYMSYRNVPQYVIG